MQTESLYAVFITLATVLGSAGAWRFYEKRAQYKKEEEDFIKDDCAKRIGPTAHQRRDQYHP